MFIHNDIIDSISFVKFNKVEIDILFSIFDLLNDEERDTVTLDYSVLSERSRYKRKNKQAFVKYLDNISVKLMTTMSRNEDETFIRGVNLFSRYQIQKDVASLTISINNEIKYLFENSSNFTVLSLDELTSLKSVYSKLFYLHLMKFKNKGLYIIKYDEFIKKFGIPIRYTTSKVREKIVDVAFEELKYIFKDLEININFKKNKPSSISFVFRPFSNNKINNADVLNRKIREIKYRVIDRSLSEEEKRMAYDELEKILLKKRNISINTFRKTKKEEVI